MHPLRYPRSTRSRHRWPLRCQRLEVRCVPAVAVWDGRPDAGGDSPDNHWTTATNWVGDAAPRPADDLQFPAGASQLDSVNDFPAGTAFHSLSVTSGGY